jgi:hypothetical protein
MVSRLSQAFIVSESSPEPPRQATLRDSQTWMSFDGGVAEAGAAPNSVAPQTKLIALKSMALGFPS